jgi:hypothetical protein
VLGERGPVRQLLLLHREEGLLILREEGPLILGSRLDLLAEVLVKDLREARISELLRQHRGDPDRDPGPDPFFEEPVDYAQEREVGLSSRLAEPV